MVKKTQSFKNAAAAAPLASGLPRFSRARQFHNKGVWAIVKKGPKAAPKQAEQFDAFKPIEVKSTKKGGKVNVYSKLSFRGNAVAAKKAPTKPNQPNLKKLRSSLTPGTVLILLAGRFAGKRVVFLKQLPSGLLLVTGPYKVNGVPLKRVDQSYVIATSTKVDISSVTVPESVNDNLWKHKKETQKGESKFFKDGENKEKKAVPQEFVALQTQVDDAVSAAVDKVQHLKEYLSNRFSLSNGVYPHDLKF
jgi:large subunit ribosomal protein L6e